MAINPNIALQVRPPQFESPVNQLAKVLQMQGLQQEQGMNRLRADKYRMEMDDYKRGQEENALLSRLYSDALKPDGTIDRNRLFSGAASGGLGSKIPGLQKTFADQDKATTDADAAKFKLAKDRYGMYQQTLGALSQEPNLSKELVLQAGQSLVQQGILPAEMFQQAAATLPDDPEQLRARLTQGLKSQLTPEQVLTLFAPKATEVSDGQTKFLQDRNTLSPTFGQQIGGAPIQMRPTPEAMLTDERTRSEGALGRGVQIRGQNMADARAREQIAQGGKAPPGYRYKPDGSMEAIPGGPADIKAGELGAKREAATQGGIAQANRVISKVDEALARVDRSTAGLGGSVMAKLPGTPAVDLRADLDTIKANLGFAELQAMRDASPTGGALGQVAVQELIALQSTVASLDPSQSPDQLRRNLAQVKKHYNNWKSTLEGRLPGSTPKAAPGEIGSGTSPAGGTPPDISDLLKKYGG